MRRNKRKDNVKRLAIGSVVAAAAGYLVGVLTAPKSGKETRGDIKNVADKSWGEAEKDLKRLNDELSNVISEAKSGGDKLGTKAQKELGTLVDKAKDTKERVREMISAVREGDAEDKDLDKAVKDAAAAVDHLRAYLKKK